MNREQARQNFQNVSKNMPRKTHVELTEAKARLRQVDAELTISPALDYLSKGNWKSALFTLVPLVIDQIKREDLLTTLATRGLPFVYRTFFTSKKVAKKI